MKFPLILTKIRVITTKQEISELLSPENLQGQISEQMVLVRYGLFCLLSLSFTHFLKYEGISIPWIFMLASH